MPTVQLSKRPPPRPACCRGRGAPRGPARGRARRAARRPSRDATGHPGVRAHDRRRHGPTQPHGLRDHASRLADAVGAVLDEGAFPIVLGGDCSILLGITLALRRRGRYGLLFLDGHADFYQPEAEPTGEAASMELALVTGRGPGLVTDLEGRGPLLRDEDVVVFGFRDADHAAAEGSRPLAPTIHAMDLSSVRERGAGPAARAALAHLERIGGPAGFWVHLDVDVLDDAIMPAVDYHLPDGLTWEELIAVLRTAVASDHATGLDITIFNPTLDPDGRVARSRRPGRRFHPVSL